MYLIEQTCIYIASCCKYIRFNDLLLVSIKSIIFICIGRFIHYIKGIQNFRFYKGIFYIYPIKRIILIISLLISCGFPFLVGFYSKDLIIERYYYNKINYLCLIISIFRIILTISYSIRIIYNLLINNIIINLIYYYEDKIINLCIILLRLTEVGLGIIGEMYTKLMELMLTKILDCSL